MCGCGCEHGHHDKHSCGCDSHGSRRACCCGGHHSGHPIFWTKEAKLSWLENYLVSLEVETKSVQSRIAELQSEA